MYGLVNRAIEQLVCEQLGEETWQEIKAKAAVGVDAFVGLEAYPDEVTYDLVGAASEVLKLPAEAILEEFGKYWVLYTGKTAYGSLLDPANSTLFSCLQNLDNLHSRVSLTMPHLHPPSFLCTDETESSIRVHYFSERQGLAPMVVGLLKGLADLYQTSVEVEQVAYLAKGDDHDIFQITLR